MQPSDSEVDAAREELRRARADLADTPRTITVPIMDDWSYKKRIFSRSTSAQLEITMGPADGQPTVVDIPLRTNWSDYKVKADPRHNVRGHSPDRGPIRDAEALVPFIARKASDTLAVRLKAAISRAALEQAKRALARSGNTQVKAGFEGVDAMAFDAVGERLQRPLLRGRARLESGQPFNLPSKAASLAPGQCLLAVAVGSSESGADLTLMTPDRSHADLRGESTALLEVCQDELSGEGVLEALRLSSETGGAARWGMYVTRQQGKPAAPTGNRARVGAAVRPAGNPAQTGAARPSPDASAPNDANRRQP